MSDSKIPSGTRIYLRKKNKETIYIKPGNHLLDDSLYVAYDVKIDGITIIPKDTRVTGDWITESHPVYIAQLQLSKIYLYGGGQTIEADSNVIEAVSGFNDDEVLNARHLRGPRIRNPANKRAIKYQCSIKTLKDNYLNTPYLEIFTAEIPVMLTKDFILTL